MSEYDALMAKYLAVLKERDDLLRHLGLYEQRCANEGCYNKITQSKRGRKNKTYCSPGCKQAMCRRRQKAKQESRGTP